MGDYLQDDTQDESQLFGDSNRDSDDGFDPDTSDDQDLIGGDDYPTSDYPEEES